MPGASIQLASTGSADDMLTGQPQFSFWHSLYKKPSRFAIESVPVSFNSTADFNARTSITIPRTGDLLHTVWLEITLPDLTLFQPSGGGITIPTTASNITYCNTVALAVLRSAELELGGSKIDSITGNSIDVWSELTVPDEKRQGLNEMWGRYDDFDNTNVAKSSFVSRTYFVPVQFYFQNEPRAALPMISLSQTDVRISFQFAPWIQCLKSSTSSIISMVDAQGNPPTMSVTAYCDQVFLDDEEKYLATAYPLQYLITTHQIQEEYVLATPLATTTQAGSVNRRISLNMTGPVKEFIFTYTTAQNLSVDTLNGNNIFDYSMPSPYTANPFSSVTLYLSGAMRQATRTGDFYRLVSNLQSHTRVPINRKMIMTYTFGKEVESQIQPGGTANFSRISDPYFLFQMNPYIANGTIRIVGHSWNVLNMSSGFGGLNYTVR